MIPKIKVTFSQEALDQFEGTEEELAEIAESIRKMVNSVIIDAPLEDPIQEYDDLFDTYMTSTSLH